MLNHNVSFMLNLVHLVNFELIMFWELIKKKQLPEPEVIRQTITPHAFSNAGPSLTHVFLGINGRFSCAINQKWNMLHNSFHHFIKLVM